MGDIQFLTPSDDPPRSPLTGMLMSELLISDWVVELLED